MQSCICMYTVFANQLTEHSALLDCTQPESSFLMQQAVSRSFSRQTSISFSILMSLRMQGANLAPRWMRSEARGPSQKFAGSWYSTCCSERLVTSTYGLENGRVVLITSKWIRVTDQSCYYAAV